MRSGSVSCDSQTRVREVRWMASRSVGYPVVVSWSSVFIINVSPVLVRMVTSLPSSFTSTTLANFQLYTDWVLGVYLTCARSKFADDAIQSGLNGSQLTLIPIVLVK